MSELSIHELETQHGELLPEREALGFTIVAFSHLVNLAEAEQAFTILSANTAVATQIVY
jgi:hypothetical protein